MVSQITNPQDLFELAKILRHQIDFQQLLKLVAHKSAQWLKADLALILMVNPDTRETIKTIIRDGKTPDQENCREIYTNVGGWIINYKKSFVSPNIHKDKRFAKDLFKGVDVKSIVGVPLIVEDIIIGTLILLYKKSLDFDSAEAVEFLENIPTISAPFLRNVQKIRQYFDTTVSESVLMQKYKNVGLLGKSGAFIELLQAIEAATKCDVRVLLDGKTGTGKELIARAIHHFSARMDGPFIAIDCGAIPATLIESELFGHARVAYTGANAERQGLFKQANGGTLFMDEINNLPYEMQSKLLRVLQDSEIRPVGSDKSYKTDVRIIAASSTPLKILVDKEEFRQDLFFRLYVFPIYIPDLNERQDDIPPLAHHFLAQFAQQQNKKAVNFHEEIIDYMKERIWQGNIRELENFVERLVTVTPPDNPSINPDILPPDLRKELEKYKSDMNASTGSTSIKDQLDKYEAELIKKALIECNWNQSKAARKLHTSEGNIRHKMNQLNIQKD